MKGNSFSVVQLNEWKDYKPFVEQFSENWAFRGQADSRKTPQQSLQERLRKLEDERYQFLP